MNPNQSRELATAMTSRSEEVMARLSLVLRDMGFEGLEIIEFKAVPREDKVSVLQTLEAETGESLLLGNAPCPTHCVVVNGMIICTPRC